MNLKDLRLDMEALLSQVVYGHGFLHYGYWPDKEPESLSLEDLGKAQARYFEKLIDTLPAGVCSILDVGSGTGSNAAALVERGFAVDCVCPSPKLNALARTKLSEDTRIFECRFEELAIDRRYDALIFCESFHYLDAEASLRLAGRYAEEYVLIFDYFRRDDAGGNDRISYRQFQALLSGRLQQVFEVVRDEDVTDCISPTFRVLDEINNAYIKPFTNRLIRDFRTQHPLYALLFSRTLKRLGCRAQRPSVRQQRFAEQNEYRLILLRRREAPASG